MESTPTPTRTSQHRQLEQQSIRSRASSVLSDSSSTNNTASSANLSSGLSSSQPTIQSLPFQQAKSGESANTTAKNTNTLLYDISKNLNELVVNKESFFPSSLLVLDQNQEVNVYDFYCSSGSSLLNQEHGSENTSHEMDERDESYDQNDKEISERLRSRIEALVKSYSSNKRTSQPTESVKSGGSQVDLFSVGNNASETNSSRSIYDDSFLVALFSVIIDTNYKAANFERIFNELDQSNVLKNVFLGLAKLGHECFKLNLLTAAENILEFALDQIDTSSMRLKMATLSTLAACYWRLKKFIESINCLNLELNLATYLHSLSPPSDQSEQNEHNKNKFRIFGNLASAYQRLNNINECLKHFEFQLELANDMVDYELIVNSLNSIGLVYNKLKDYKKSFECFSEGLKIIESNLSLKDKQIVRLQGKQLSLIGESCLKLGQYAEAKQFFINQLEVLNLDTNDENLNFNESVALMNLGCITFKLKDYEMSVEFYQRCFNILLNLDNEDRFEIVELFGGVFIGLINNYLATQEFENAAMYAESMLEYTLKELAKLESSGDKKIISYLKYLEMTGCFKLAICKAKKQMLDEAFTLHEREAELARELSNVLFLVRAYSNMAQIYYLKQEYEPSIDLYKEILGLIESKLLVSSNSSISSSSKTTILTIEKIKKDQKKRDDESANDTHDSSSLMNKSDERFVEIIYFTLSNIGLCMEKLMKFEDSLLMYHEQAEISKLLTKNLKYRANALLNLINLFLTGKVNDDIQNHRSLLISSLEDLLKVYTELKDKNGQLFISQCLAYKYHTSGNLHSAVDCYLFSIEVSKALNKPDNLGKSLFNLSLCYKLLHNYHQAYRYQMEYYKMCKTDNYNRMISLGVLSDLLIEASPSEQILQKCIKINLDRLKLIKNLAVVNDQDLIENEETVGKFVLDCLEKISKCYGQLSDFEQALKFKYLQLDLLNEQKVCDYKRAIKLWLDMGSIYLSKMNNPVEAKKYFEMVLKVGTDNGDLLIVALAYGNLGLCAQKLAEFKQSVELFEKQVDLLEEKLSQVEGLDLVQDLSESNSNSSDELSIFVKLELNIKTGAVEFYREEKIGRIREAISIRIDLGRSFAKMGKSYEFMYAKTRKNGDYFNQAALFYSKYCSECKYLYNMYIKSYFTSMEHLKEQEKDTEKLQTTKLYMEMNDLIEQIFIDYDTSLAKLSNFYLAGHGKVDKPIEITEYRLELLKFSFKYLVPRSQLIYHMLFIQINFSLAQLHFKQDNKSPKSLQYCENLFDFYNKNILVKDIYYIKILSLYSDFMMFNEECKARSSRTDSLYQRVMEFYRLVWEADKTELFKSIANTGDLGINRSTYSAQSFTIYIEIKLLQLRFESTAKLYLLYSNLNSIKECLEILSDSLTRLLKEFQAYQSERQKSGESQGERELEASSKYLLKFIDYLYQLNLKMAFVYLKQDNKSLLKSAVKHLSEAFIYMNYQKEFEQATISNELLNTLRQANGYFIQGLCFAEMKDYEMQLEMLASSLDLYENVDNRNRQLSLKHNHLLFSDEDEFERTQDHFLDNRIKNIYNSIIDCLVRTDKLKEALLVSERLRARGCAHLHHLPDIISYTQIESLFQETNVNSILYYSRAGGLVESSVYNCWLMQRGLLKFERVDLKSVVQLGNDFNDLIVNLNEDERSKLLSIVYQALIKPFESYLFPSGNNEKQLVCIIYDEQMLQVPFHLLQAGSNWNDRHLYELCELDCFYSLKYLLFKNKSYNQKFIKHNSTSIPMKIVSSATDLSKLLSTSSSTRLNAYQFDLVFILISLDNRDLGLLNNLVNNIMSKRISKSVLIHYSDETTDKEAEQRVKSDFEFNGHEFITTLYSKMGQRTDLKSSVLFQTLLNESDFRKTGNYLLFGNLGLTLLQSLTSEQIYIKSRKSNLIEDIKEESEQEEESVQDEVNEDSDVQLLDDLAVSSGTNSENGSEKDEKSSENDERQGIDALTVKSEVEMSGENRPDLTVTSSETQRTGSDVIYEQKPDLILVEVEGSMSDHSDQEETVLSPPSPVVESSDQTDHQISIRIKPIDQVIDHIEFGQAITEFMKICSELDEHSSKYILNFLTSLLHEFLFGDLVDAESIDFKSYFEKYCLYLNVDQRENTNLIGLIKSLFRSLGFCFFIHKTSTSQDEVLRLKLPEKSLSSKLKLIQKCLFILNDFSFNFLKQLCELTKSSTGKQFLIYMNKCKPVFIRDAYHLKLDKKIYDLYRSFFDELAARESRNEGSKVEIEIDYHAHKSLGLIISILLNNDLKSKTDEELEAYVEEFFARQARKARGDEQQLESDLDDNDLTSQYSTMSSLIGLKASKKIQVDPDTVPSGSELPESIEIKIYRELSFVKSKQQEYEKSSSLYDKYMTELTERDIIKPETIRELKRLSNTARSARLIPIKINKSEENETSLPNSMIRLEEKEYLDQMITTTTTVTTLTSDSMMMLFDPSVPYDLIQEHHHHHHEHKHVYGNNNFNSDSSFFHTPCTGSAYSNSFSQRATNNTTAAATPNKNSPYSCLSNYYSDF